MKQLCKICTNKRCLFAFMSHGERVILCPSLTQAALKAYVDNLEAGRALTEPSGIIEQSNITSSVITQPFGLFRFIVN